MEILLFCCLKLSGFQRNAHRITVPGFNGDPVWLACHNIIRAIPFNHDGRMGWKKSNYRGGEEHETFNY